MSEHLTHKLHADGSGEVLCETDSPLPWRTTHGDDVTCPECRRIMKSSGDARLTVAEDAVRALAELRQRIKGLAREYEGQDAPRGIHPREVARDLRRLLEK